MKTKLIIAFVALLSISVINASAQKNRGLHDENQQIQQGIQSGQLTGKEIAMLQTEKNRLKAETRRYKRNDGHIDQRERADLRRDNRRLNNNICRQKNDRQRRR